MWGQAMITRTTFVSTRVLTKLTHGPADSCGSLLTDSAKCRRVVGGSSRLFTYLANFIGKENAKNVNNVKNANCGKLSSNFLLTRDGKNVKNFNNTNCGKLSSNLLFTRESFGEKIKDSVKILSNKSYINNSRGFKTQLYKDLNSRTCLKRSQYNSTCNNVNKPYKDSSNRFQTFSKPFRDSIFRLQTLCIENSTCNIANSRLQTFSKPYKDGFSGLQTLPFRDSGPRTYSEQNATTNNNNINKQCNSSLMFQNQSHKNFRTNEWKEQRTHALNGLSRRTYFTDVLRNNTPHKNSTRMFQPLPHKNSTRMFQTLSHKNGRTGKQKEQEGNKSGSQTFHSSSSILANSNLLSRAAVDGVLLSSIRHVSRERGGIGNLHNRISSLQLKKRTQRKKKKIQEDTEEEWQVTAYATADEYNLDKLMAGLLEQGLYTPTSITSDETTEDVLHVFASYKLEAEHREIYFFREGSVVFWNIGELERANVLRFLEAYEEGPFNKDVVQEESESLAYKYSDVPVKTKLVRDKITLNPEGQTTLEKYTFSNALAMSVKLGIWEASLDTYIDNIEYVSEELSKTGRVVLSQDEVLQRLGQLCALRHLLNLSSDLLDVPDFYWEHEEFEQLYKKTSDYLSVTKRTSVMNVKLNHCIELMELLKSHLNESHSSRLEWIIIILIMVEVIFELLHFLERFL